MPKITRNVTSKLSSHQAPTLPVIRTLDARKLKPAGLNISKTGCSPAIKRQSNNMTILTNAITAGLLKNVLNIVTNVMINNNHRQYSANAKIT